VFPVISWRGKIQVLFGDGTIRFGDNDRSVLPCMHHVAARSEGSAADELDGRLWNIMDQGAEAGGTDMRGRDSCSWEREARWVGEDRRGRW